MEKIPDSELKHREPCKNFLNKEARPLPAFAGKDPGVHHADYRTFSLLPYGDNKVRYAW